MFVSSSLPDLVVIDNSTALPAVYLFELTICFERHEIIEKANKYTYSSLTQDIKDAGYGCKNKPFEVGSRKHLTLENKSKHAIIHKLCQPKAKFSKL